MNKQPEFVDSLYNNYIFYDYSLWCRDELPLRCASVSFPDVLFVKFKGICQNISNRPFKGKIRSQTNSLKKIASQFMVGSIHYGPVLVSARKEPVSMTFY